MTVRRKNAFLLKRISYLECNDQTDTLIQSCASRTRTADWQLHYMPS
jgi:hypothetical protein